MLNPQNIVGHQFKPGESGNPNGRPKGSKSLASIIRELENEDFDWDKMPLNEERAKDKIDVLKSIGSPFRAIVFVALAQAAGGDRHAREWLRKAGYGDKLDITSDGERVQAATIVDLGNIANVATDQPEAESDSPSDQEPPS